MFKFKTRSQARAFAAKRSTYKVIDLLSGCSLLDAFKISAGISKRWAVKVL